MYLKWVCQKLLGAFNKHGIRLLAERWQKIWNQMTTIYNLIKYLYIKKNCLSFLQKKKNKITFRTTQNIHLFITDWCVALGIMQNP